MKSPPAKILRQEISYDPRDGSFSYQRSASPVRISNDAFVLVPRCWMDPDELRRLWREGDAQINAVLTYPTGSSTPRYRVRRGGSAPVLNHDEGTVMVPHQSHVHVLRLAWVLMTGSYPPGELMWKDKDQSNNRWSNINLADKQLRATFPKPRLSGEPGKKAGRPSKSKPKSSGPKNRSGRPKVPTPEITPELLLQMFPQNGKTKRINVRSIACRISLLNPGTIKNRLIEYLDGSPVEADGFMISYQYTGPGTVRWEKRRDGTWDQIRPRGRHFITLDRPRPEPPKPRPRPDPVAELLS